MEQKKIQGLEWEPQVKQTALLASPASLFQLLEVICIHCSVASFQLQGQQWYNSTTSSSIFTSPSLTLSLPVPLLWAHEPRWRIPETLPISVQFSRSVMSDSATPWMAAHRLPYPPSTPRACSNLCPSSRWCHPTISSSVIPSSSAFNLSQHQGLFQWVSYSHQVAKVLEFQL